LCASAGRSHPPSTYCLPLRLSLLQHYPPNPIKTKKNYKDPLNEYDTTGGVNTLKKSMRKKGWIHENANRGHYTDCITYWLAQGGWKRARAHQEGEQEGWVDPENPGAPLEDGVKSLKEDFDGFDAIIYDIEMLKDPEARGWLIESANVDNVLSNTLILIDRYARILELRVEIKLKERSAMVLFVILFASPRFPSF
jgi:hypothetical protein